MGEGSHIQMSLPDLLNNLQMILTEEDVGRPDLTAPTPQRVQMLYIKLLMEFGMSESMLQPAAGFHGLHASQGGGRRGGQGGGGGGAVGAGSWDDHPYLYEHNQDVDTLKDAVSYFFDTVGHVERPAFGLLDLIEPEPKRTRRFLASMVNFWQFCNTNYEDANEGREAVAEKAAIKASLAKDIAELKERSDQIRKSNSEDAEKASKLEEKMVKMKSELSEYVSVIEADKERREKTKAALAESAEEEQKLAREVDDLRRREDVVRAGLRNVGELEEMEAELARLKDEGNDLQAREKVIEHKTAELAAKSKDLEAVCEQLKTVQVVNDQTKSMVLNDLSTAERKAQLLAAEAADLTSQIEGWAHKRSELQNQLASEERKWKRVREMKQAEVEMLEGEGGRAKKQLSEDEVVAAEFQSRARRAEREAGEARKAAERGAAVAENETIKILEATRDRHAEIEARKEEVRKLIRKL